MPDISEPVFRYPISAVMFHRYATVVVGGALEVTHDANDDFAMRARQQPAANGDVFTQSCYLASGSYTLRVMGETDVDEGILDWYIDNVLVAAGQDWYSGIQVRNIDMTVAVNVVGSGRHTLKGVVNGQNVASTGYRIRLVILALA